MASSCHVGTVKWNWTQKYIFHHLFDFPYLLGEQTKSMPGTMTLENTWLSSHQTWPGIIRNEEHGSTKTRLHAAQLSRNRSWSCLAYGQKTFQQKAEQVKSVTVFSSVPPGGQSWAFHSHLGVLNHGSSNRLQALLLVDLVPVLLVITSNKVTRNAQTLTLPTLEQATLGSLPSCHKGSPGS